MKFLLSLFLLATPQTSSHRAVESVIRTMSIPGVDVVVLYRDCGGVNAAYAPWLKAVLVCNELLKEPEGVQRFVAAHEMAHAIIDQRAIPVPGSEEAAADELGALALLATGQEDAVLAMSIWFLEHAKGGENVEDDHQSFQKRAHVLACLADGSEADPDSADCEFHYLHAVSVWRRLLKL